MKDKRLNILRILILLTGLVLFTASENGCRRQKDAKIKEAVIEKKQFVCSMHPQIVQDMPGDCPICGMTLIEKIDNDKNMADSNLDDVVKSVNESVLGSIATVNPIQTEIPVTIEASGIVNFDPRKIRTVSAKFGGVIEKSFIKYQFQPVKKGQKIYEIYCPDVYTAKWNYVKLIQLFPDQDSLTVEAREWLTILGLTKGQIDSLKRATKPNYHLPVYSDVEGYAVSTDFDPDNYFANGDKEESLSESRQSSGGKLGFYPGITVETGTPVFKVVDIKSLRVDLNVRTEDIGLLKKGQNVSIRLSSSPDIKYEGTINLIEPLNGGLFQLVKVYLTDNKGLLVPGRQIQASIMTGNRNTLWIPKTSVVDLGQHQSVFVKQGDKFIARTVKTGIRTSDKIEILSGIDQNTTIALKGLLLTDSDGFIVAGSDVQESLPMR